MLHQAYFVCAHVSGETDLELFASPCAMKQKLRDIGSEKDYVRIVYVGECKRNSEGRWTVRIDYEKHGHNGEDTLKSFLPTEDRSTQIAVFLDDKYPASPEWLADQALKETEEFHLTHQASRQ